MSKKILSLIIFSFIICINLQASVGSWKIHAIYGSEITNIIDTGSKIYYLVSENLYSYDKDNDESEHYSKQTKLSDVNISNIYYNYDSSYLVIVYENSNIDILYDDGSVINVPDIYNSDITDKTIYRVTFNASSVYIGAEFGYVILNANKSFEVSESHNYGVAVRSVAKIGNYIWLSTTTDLFYSPASETHHSMSSFSGLSAGYGGDIYIINDSTFFFNTWALHRVSFSNTSGSPKLDWLQDIGQLTFMQPTRDGFLGIDQKSPANMLLFNSDGSSYTTTALPDDMQTSLISTYESDGSIWCVNEKGLRHITIADGGTTVHSDYFKYNSSTISYPRYLRYNTGLNKLYVLNGSQDKYQRTYGVVGRVNTLGNGTWADISPTSAPTIGTDADSTYKDPYYPAIDPDDPETYFVGSWYEGMYKITGSEVVNKYDWTNSPIDHSFACIISGLGFDANKNLWAIQGVDNPKILVLPRAKQSLSEVTESDWIVVDVSIPSSTDFRVHTLITEKTDIKVMVVNSTGNQLLVINDNGDPSSSSLQYKLYQSGSLYDQDESAFTWGYITSLAEDADGMVWMGTDNGVIEFNPSNAQNSNFRINRLKVPRNDGTNYADYLLTGIEISAIAVDGANRKWLGTVSNGIYLVSEDGSSILQHFTTSNSMLISDQIISICCDPNSNSVYIGTPNGLVEYYSDAAPASADYSSIYAYPNPVRPDFTGNITITGLMENSLVKIADSAGNVIRSLQSTGGLATWDGCYSNGARVKTGVYYVLASQNENSTSSGVVTKILVIK